MIPPLTQDYLERLSAALIREIKAEMGRKDVRSMRALSRMLGHTSPQYISSRLGNDPKTGQPRSINVKDLAAIAHVLDTTPAELIERAKAVADTPDELAARRGVPAVQNEAARNDDPKGGE